jgi:hypothetical protein
VAKRSPDAGDRHDRGVAIAMARSEALEKTKALANGCEPSARRRKVGVSHEVFVAEAKQGS